MDATSLSGDIFNIGSTERVTILELAERVLKVTDSRSTITYIPYGEVYGQGIEDMYHREPSIEKVRGAIGWSPNRSLDEILSDVLEQTRHAPVCELEPDPAEA
jgi:nucleoside-diphosphate-sugar epimerase